MLDDDPTGTQTVRRIAVLTEWSVESLKTELTAAAPGFFILTNSRALPTQEARRLTQEICANVNAAAKASGVACTVVLRGDSCLRGHYPAEVDAAAKEFGGFDATVICPFFLQGGRYTINDVHYVAAGDVLTPVSETEFAKDKARRETSPRMCDTAFFLVSVFSDETKHLWYSVAFCQVQGALDVFIFASADGACTQVSWRVARRAHAEHPPHHGKSLQ